MKNLNREIYLVMAEKYDIQIEYFKATLYNDIAIKIKFYHTEISCEKEIFNEVFDKITNVYMICTDIGKMIKMVYCLYDRKIVESV